MMTIICLHNAEKKGLVVPELSNSIQIELKKMLPANARYRNPIDCAFDMNLPYFYITLPEVLMMSGEIDAIIQYGVVGFQDVMDDYLKYDKIAQNAEFGHQSDEVMDTFAKKLVEPTVNNSKKYGIPIIHVSPMPFNSPWSRRLRKNGFILFKLWDRLVNALAKICQYSQFKDKIRQKDNE